MADIYENVNITGILIGGAKDKSFTITEGKDAGKTIQYSYIYLSPIVRSAWSSPLLIKVKDDNKDKIETWLDTAENKKVLCECDLVLARSKKDLVIKSLKMYKE